MIILCDSREQTPLRFKHEALEGTERKALPFGDYWCEYKDGSLCPYIIERKAIGDFFGSFGGKGYDNEKNKLEKFQKDERFTKYIVVIEATFGEVLKGYSHSTVKGLSVARTMMTWWVKYNVVPCYVPRKDLNIFIAELFYSYGMNKVQDEKREVERKLRKKRKDNKSNGKKSNNK